MRTIHYWLTPLLILPFAIVVGSGLLLQLKKELPWVQPPTAMGANPGTVPAVSLALLVDLAIGDQRMQVSDPGDIQRIQIEIGKGVAKIISKSGMEMQVDTSSGETLTILPRRSDTIEAIHDGSYFGQFVKDVLFLTAGFLYILLAVTGLWLFLRFFRARI